MVALSQMTGKTETSKLMMEGYTVNCKPGDLAVIVRASVVSNIGKIVTVTRYEKDVLMVDGSRRDGWRFSGPVMKGINGYDVNVIPDSFLRPIRDQYGTDEMIRIAGLPHKEHA